ncbi:MAG: glycosyltransferase family 4 protein [Magnetospiraceae bacterium]
MIAEKRLRILTFSTLYPNAAQPNHGVFVETRLRRLVETHPVDVQVMAPVPWFPSTAPRFGSYAKFAAAPKQETRFDIPITHPCYPVIPRVGMTIAPYLLYRAVRAPMARMLEQMGGADLIDAHYFYPDGVAAALLARDFGLPFTVTARGTDINLIPQHALPRKQILWAAKRADAMITVCQALKDALLDLGVPGDNIHPLRNGVDLDLFSPKPRAAARAAFGLSAEETVLVSVGALIERKGHHITIAALPALPGMRLLIAGDGPERANLLAQAAELGVADRVRLLGPVPHGNLADLYTAADLSILSSSREGWANVLLESMACGTPVIATDVWGTPEVVASPAAGVLMKDRTADALAAATTQALAAGVDRAATRTYAENFDWRPTSDGLYQLFAKIAGQSEGR